MNVPCRSFRRMLERALEGGRGQDELTNLSWHEHLMTCGDCRALLESEEALELLLSTLPEPNLPPKLTRRVLARLRATEDEREDQLDRLLDLDARARAPSDLARRVLAKLEDERAAPSRSAAEERRLDALLDRLPAAEVPPGLARRVTAHLAEERALARRGQVVRGGRFSTRRTRVLLAAAASLAVALTLWALWPRHDAVRREDELAQLPGSKVDSRLLENLDVLEEWELLDSGNVDILLSTLPVADQWLLELASEEGAPAPEKLDKEGPKPKKG